MTERPARITWFVDRSLGHSVADALRGAGEAVVHHDDLFPSDAADENWLPVVGSKGWAVLTKDKNIRLHRNEREALVAGKVRAFFLSGGNLTGAEQQRRFVGALQAMTAMATTIPAPFLALVGATGVTLLVQPPKRPRR